MKSDKNEPKKQKFRLIYRLEFEVEAETKEHAYQFGYTVLKQAMDNDEIHPEVKQYRKRKQK